jgi:hypothetical protein
MTGQTAFGIWWSGWRDPIGAKIARAVEKRDVNNAGAMEGSLQ